MHPVSPGSDPQSPDTTTPEPSGTPMHPADGTEAAVSIEEPLAVPPTATLTTATPMHPVEAAPRSEFDPVADTSAGTSPMHPGDAVEVSATATLPTETASLMHPATVDASGSTGSSLAHPEQ
jgi:hypothetical protein